VALLAAAAALATLAGCGGGGGTAAPTGGGSTGGTTPTVTNQAPVVSNASLTIAATSGGGAGSVQGDSVTLPVGGGTIAVSLDAADPEGSTPVVVVSLFNNNSGTETKVTKTTPTSGTTYRQDIPVAGNLSTSGLAVTYLVTARVADAAGLATTLTLGTILVPGASSPPVPPPPTDL